MKAIVVKYDGSRRAHEKNEISVCIDGVWYACLTSRPLTARGLRKALAAWAKHGCHRLPGVYAEVELSEDDCCGDAYPGVKEPLGPWFKCFCWYGHGDSQAKREMMEDAVSRKTIVF